MDLDTDTCIADYFFQHFPMRQLVRQMYSKKNIYGRIPELIFRFSDVVSDEIYNDLKCCVASFEGGIRWIVFENFYGEKNRNYSLVPEKFYLMKKELFGENRSMGADKFFTENEYKEICEKSIKDIPWLCQYIQKNFQWKESYRQL